MRARVCVRIGNRNKTEKNGSKAIKTDREEGIL